LRLAPSKRSKRVGVALFSPEGNRPSYRNAVFSNYLEFWTMGKVHKPSDSEWCIPFRFHNLSASYFAITKLFQMSSTSHTCEYLRLSLFLLIRAEDSGLGFIDSSKKS
jgi:hypothetical protein